MDEDILRRIGKVEDRYSTILETLAQHTVALNEIKEDQRAIVAELGGAPESDVRGDRETIRWRLHTLENDRSAAVAAQAALTAARSARAQAWSRSEKMILFVFAAVSALGIVLRIFGVGG